MKIIAKIVLVILGFAINFSPIIAEESPVFNAGVSIEEVPEMIFGSWSVQAKIVDSNNYGSFKPKSVDLWNISRNGNVLNLSNPFTGASADVQLNATQGNVVSFTRIVDFDNKKLTDVVTIRLEKNSFTGINELKLEQFSLVDNHLMRTDTARYEIKGTKLSGGDVLNTSN